MSERLLEERLGGARVWLLGTVPGFIPDEAVVVRAFDRVDPDVVGLGVSPDELEGLLEFLETSGDADAPEVPEIPEDDPYVRHLATYGDVALPPPDLVAAVETALEHGVPLVALDLEEEEYTDRFTGEVSLWQLFRSTRQEKRLARRPPDADTALEFHHLWNAERRRLKGIRAVERAREAHMARALRELAGDHHRVLAVVEASKVEGVRAALHGSGNA